MHEVLRTNSMLRTLRLGHSKMGSGAAGGGGVMLISAALKKNSTLTSLDLSHNCMVPNDVVVMANALFVNKGLQVSPLALYCTVL